MLLTEFIARFESLDDAGFRATFDHPFLLEGGQVLGKGTPLAERSVFLLRDKGQTLVVGRKAAAHLQVPVKSVSSKHALLRPPTEGRPDWEIIDAESTNGTFVEGVRIAAGKPTRLTDGVALRFGPDARFNFLQPESFLRAFRRLLSAGDNPPVTRDILGSDTETNLQRVSLDDSGQQRLVEAGVELLIQCDPFDPLPIQPGETVILGRSPRDATLVLPHKNVSRRHAELERRDDQVFVRDLGSANGSFIGKTKIGPAWEELLIGKKLVIGPFVLNLQGPVEALGHTQIVQADPSEWSATIKGSLADTPVIDIVNDVEMNQVTGVLRIECGKLRALLSFRNGEPVDADCNDGSSGDDAVRKLLDLTHGRFWLDPEATVPEEEPSKRRVTRTFSEFALDDFFDG